MLEPFFTTKPHGNGLGLSICRSVLWEVDGTLTIQSEPGNGTDVHVLRSAGGVATAPAVVMRPARILVVDDEPGMLRAVERVLSEDHHVIGTRLVARCAVGGRTSFSPELAIVDIRMPDLDGFELMAQLKARFPALDVILMTGSVDDLDEKLVRAIRSPAFYFIQKPFDREVLRTLVERCVELRWRREDHRQNLKRLENEMAEARAFQQSLLPDREAIVNRVAVCCRYTPCSALGGDLYDYAAAAAGQDRAADR